MNINYGFGFEHGAILLCYITKIKIKNMNITVDIYNR
jgi:hypothetical protein